MHGEAARPAAASNSLRPNGESLPVPTTETIPMAASPVAAAPAAAVAEEPPPLYIPPREEIVNEPEAPESAEPPEVESPSGLAPAVGSPLPEAASPPKGMPKEWREWVEDRLASVSERHGAETEAIRNTVEAFVVEVRERFAATDRKVERLAADFEAFKSEVLRLIAASEERTGILVRNSEKRLRALIRKTEKRVTKRVTKRLTKVVTRLIAESEGRLKALIAESEGRLKALVAETQARADKRMDRMETRNNILFAALLAGVFSSAGALFTAWLAGLL